ncbi:MAG: helix-turn-helix domain-containing protein [Candidatus Izemoplasmataceae bacterium]
MKVKVTLDAALKNAGMTSKELAGRIGITEANLSILRSNKAKGIRFETLTKICVALECMPADILTLVGDDE